MSPHVRLLPFTVLVLPIVPLAAQSDAELRAAVDRVAPRMIELRHDIHQHPELGNRETRTAGLIAGELRRLGLEVRTGVATTGVIGILRGGKPGPVIALRADMDALPITERNDLPFKSTLTTTYLGRETGVMHACGHDTHVAAQLGVANVLAGMRAQLKGTVVFIFQPAEEGLPPGEVGGGKQMVAEGALENPRPEMIFAFHANGDPPDAEGDRERLGRVSYSVGPTMAAATKFIARIHGRPAHGSTPHLSVDAVVTASEVVLALQTIRSRNLSPFSDNVLTVGVLQAGDRNNIVAGEAYLEGTIRTFELATLETIERRMREIFDGITKSAGATFELEFDRSHPLTANDTALTRRFVPSLQRAAGTGNVVEVPPRTGAEDFSYFSQQIPGLYVFIGGVPDGMASTGHHTPGFYVDDQTVPNAIRVMATLAIDALNGGPPRAR